MERTRRTSRTGITHTFHTYVKRLRIYLFHLFQKHNKIGFIPILWGFITEQVAFCHLVLLVPNIKKCSYNHHIQPKVERRNKNNGKL